MLQQCFHCVLSIHPKLSVKIKKRCFWFWILFRRGVKQNMSRGAEVIRRACFFLSVVSPLNIFSCLLSLVLTVCQSCFKCISIWIATQRRHLCVNQKLSAGGSAEEARWPRNRPACVYACRRVWVCVLVGGCQHACVALQGLGVGEERGWTGWCRAIRAICNSCSEQRQWKGTDFFEMCVWF